MDRSRFCDYFDPHVKSCKDFLQRGEPILLPLGFGKEVKNHGESKKDAS